MPGQRIQILPTFIGGSQALWGRGGFFSVFRVSFDEPGQSFEVVPHREHSGFPEDFPNP
jgi:hypothetical protein